MLGFKNFNNTETGYFFLTMTLINNPDATTFVIIPVVQN